MSVRSSSPTAADSSRRLRSARPRSTVRGAFAERARRAPRPRPRARSTRTGCPLDTDNDLIIVNDAHHPGRRRDHPPDRHGSSTPRATRSATRWSRSGSATPTGVYLHTADSDRQEGPAGQELPGIRPVPHRLDRRVLLPHHQAGAVPGPRRRTSTSRSRRAAGAARRPSATSRAHPGNEQDGIYRERTRPASAREAITIDFAPINGSPIGELAAKFDIVVGLVRRQRSGIPPAT